MKGGESATSCEDGPRSLVELHHRPACMRPGVHSIDNKHSVCFSKLRPSGEDCKSWKEKKQIELQQSKSSSSESSRLLSSQLRVTAVCNAFLSS
jgi:hypothetical protein